MIDTSESSSYYYRLHLPVIPLNEPGEHVFQVVNPPGGKIQILVQPLDIAPRDLEDRCGQLIILVSIELRDGSTLAQVGGTVSSGWQAYPDGDSASLFARDWPALDELPYSSVVRVRVLSPCGEAWRAIVEIGFPKLGWMTL